MKSFKTYGEFLSEKFAGRKVQKISVNGGFSCPNRDGTFGRGGCIYCNNASFSPGYTLKSTDILSQIEAGKRFFGRKYSEMSFLAYFQSFTNTYKDSGLEELYRTALEAENVAGIIIGTRPDCLPDEIITMLARLNGDKPVLVELGAESFHDRTLKLINRGHDVKTTANTVMRLSEAGLSTGLHLIFGLPGESRRDMLNSVSEACRLPIDSIKFHHLQIIKDTPLAGRWARGELSALNEAPEKCAEDNEITLWEVEPYLEFCREVIDIVPRGIAIERFTASAPSELLLAPRWGLKNYQFMNLLRRNG